MTAHIGKIPQVGARHRDIVRDLVNRLPRNAESSGKKDWTIAVKGTMHELCLQYLGSCANEFWGTHRDCLHREWLLDVAWYVQSKDEEEPEEGLVLALESEWADDIGEVMFDFSKVLSMKAPIKLLLFEAGNNSRRTASDQIERLNLLCRRWQQHSCGDALYAINFHDGEHETYFGEATRDGAIPDFDFGLLSEFTGPDSSRAEGSL
jgi:hypothetical protein